MTEKFEETSQLGAKRTARELGALQQGGKVRGSVGSEAHDHPHDHLALIYEDRDEQRATVVPFIRQGLEQGERCLYVADERTRAEVLEMLREADVDVDAAIESGALEVVTVRETYLQDGTFDVEQSLARLEEAMATATADFEGFRVTVEESWLLRNDSVTEDFMQLEARVNELIHGEECVALCQYDRERFPAEVIQQVIRTHPNLVYDNDVTDNIYYRPPDEFLGPEEAANVVDRQLETVQDRTETRQANQRVVEALEAAREGISLLDEDGVFTYVNDAYADTFGYDAAEMVGEHWEDLGIEANAEYMYDEVLPTIEGEGRWTGTTTCVRNDDSTFLAEHSLTQTADDEIVCIVRDVTERSERKRRLEESQRRYEALVENFPNGVVGLFDEDLRYQLVGGQALAEIGTSEEEVVGKSLQERYPADLVEQLEPNFRAALRGESNEFEFEFHDRHWDAHTVPISDQQGDVFAGMIMVQDSTERTKRERELERALDLLNKTERIADVAGWEVDPETEEPYWSDHLFEILDVDYDDQPTLDQALDVYHSPEDRAIVEDAVEEAIESGEPFDVEARFPRPDGDVGWLRVQGDPEVEDGEVVSLRGAVQDTTERKRREQQLEEAVDKLETSNDRLKQFAYAASHDLQEPLRMVSSYLQLLENQYRDDLDETAQEYIDFAVDGADRMRTMVDDLLAYSRVEQSAAAYEPVESAAILERVTDDLQVKIEESDADIRVDSLPTITADADQVEQLFQNLLSNAIKYSGDEPPRIEISAERRDEMWEFAVADNGIGIDPEKTDRIFEVFKRLHHETEYDGTGIGLSLCQEIVANHGGEIWAESEPGEGSTFRFTLPAADTAVPN